MTHAFDADARPGKSRPAPVVGPEARTRLRLLTRLLPVLPGPRAAAMSTSEVALTLAMTSGQQDKVLRPFLTRLALAGLLTSARSGKALLWRATPLLGRLVDLLPADGEPVPAETLATGLGVSPATLNTALGALQWCEYAEPIAGPGGEYWRCRAHTVTSSVVTVIGTARPDSRTRHLAEATLDALTESRTLLTDDHQVLEVRHLEQARSPRAWLARATLTVRQAQLLIVATPTRHATVPGLLKHLLDQIDPGALTGVVAVIAVADTPTSPSPAATTLADVLHHLGARVPAAPLLLHGPVDPRHAAVTWAEHNSELIRLALARKPPPLHHRSEHAIGPPCHDRSSGHTGRPEHPRPDRRRPRPTRHTAPNHRPNLATRST